MEEKREVLGCPVKCEKSVVIACAPKRILPKVPVTGDLLAHVILSKFDDRQPLYHQEKQFASRHGINISRQNLSRWVVDAAKLLIPLLNGLKDSIVNHDIASMDATTLQVLNEPCDAQQLSLTPIVLEAEVKKKRLLSMNIMRKITNNLSKIGMMAFQVQCTPMLTPSLVLYMHKIM